MSSQPFLCGSRIERPTATSAHASASHSAPAKPGSYAAIACEPGACLRRTVRPSVMRRRHLHIFDSVSAVTLVVFDADIRKFHVAILVGQVTFASPLLDFLRRSVRATRSIRPAA